MKTKPILFSTPMVQAIVAGNKTQTRRVVKFKGSDYDTVLPLKAGGYMFTRAANKIKQELREHFDKKGIKGVQCPYNVGQVLWVRETFNVYGIEPHTGIQYKADYNAWSGGGNWKPSIFMPKTAARIFLQVTEVRVERLQAISEADAKAEGVKPITDALNNIYTVDGYNVGHTLAFEELWDSINAKKAPWNSNPWVWVITFERIEKPENF